MSLLQISPPKEPVAPTTKIIILLLSIEIVHRQQFSANTLIDGGSGSNQKNADVWWDNSMGSC
jgi:hypothetical protein